MYTREWRCECRNAVAERGLPGNRSRGRHDERLDHLDHLLVVGVRLVELEHREFGVVRPVDALVPKIVADLIYALQAADHQPLEVQLVSNPEIQWHVQRAMMRHERPGRRAAVLRLQNRSLDLEKVSLLEKRAQRRDHPRPRAEQRAHLGMHGEIGVPLAISLLGIGEARMTHELSVDHLFLAERERPE